jgi:hypothetical protein
MRGIKTGGRQKGTPNKVTSEIKEALQGFISNELNELIPKINELQVNERFNVLIKLMPYVMPKADKELELESKAKAIETIRVEPLVYTVIDIDGKPYKNRQ